MNNSTLLLIIEIMLDLIFYILTQYLMHCFKEYVESKNIKKMDSWTKKVVTSKSLETALSSNPVPL